MGPDLRWEVCTLYFLNYLTSWIDLRRPDPQSILSIPRIRHLSIKVILLFVLIDLSRYIHWSRSSIIICLLGFLNSNIMASIIYRPELWSFYCYVCLLGIYTQTLANRHGYAIRTSDKSFAWCLHTQTSPILKQECKYIFLGTSADITLLWSRSLGIYTETPINISFI